MRMVPVFMVPVLALGTVAAAPAIAQEIVTGVSTGSPHAPAVTPPPSVDDGLANGIAKTAGAPSVGDGRASGVVKSPGAPSVGDGVANGVVKLTTIKQ